MTGDARILVKGGGLRGDARILADLRLLTPWLELPGDNRPSAGALAVRLQVETGRRVNYRRLAQLLTAAGLNAKRRAGGWGYDRGELLAGLAEGGSIAELAEKLAAQESGGGIAPVEV